MICSQERRQTVIYSIFKADINILKDIQYAYTDENTEKQGRLRDILKFLW